MINTLALRLEAGEAAQREQRRDWLRELDVCWSRKPVPTARIHTYMLKEPGAFLEERKLLKRRPRKSYCSRLKFPEAPVNWAWWYNHGNPDTWEVEAGGL